MMDELRELYQQIILDHNKNPKNFYAIENPTHFSEGYNPLCGDRINVYMKIEDNVIKDISFQGSGCAISKASASVMTSELKGKKVDEAQKLFDIFHKLITGEIDPGDIYQYGKLAVFAGVREFPVRVKCAALAWHTMLAALKKEKSVVSTE
ncbi:MAG: SUF system NifU family Fe-S cluster assembly protein [Calditrichaeota bacterium]|nr:MAG: SUF system NifU family Fe-S cluster assembly protein [Calditrichota bacterium]